MYDERGQVTSGTDAERGTTTTAYNAFGEVVSRQDAIGRQTTREYDALGRQVTGKVTQNGVSRSISTNHYDTDPTPTGTRTRLGMLMSNGLTDFTSPSGGTVAVTGASYFYDNLSRVNQVLQRVPQTSNPSALESLTFLFEYDSFGRPTSIFYPKVTGQTSGVKVGYDYGSPTSTNGRLTGARVVAPAGAEEVLWTTKATDSQDRLVEEEAGDGVKTKLNLDVLGRVTGQDLRTSTTDVQPSRQLLAESYGYDAEGNLRAREKTSDVGSQMAEKFEYDPLDRVTQTILQYPDPCPLGGCESLTADKGASAVADPGPPPPPGPGVSTITKQTDDWSYDKLGNITSSKRRGNYTYDQSKPTQLKTITGGVFGNRAFSYDAIGNQTGRPDGQVAYNDMNLPATISAATKGAPSSSFMYYPTGERARKTTSTGITTYVPGLYERQESGTRTEHRFLVQAEGRTVATLRYNQEGTVGVKLPTYYVHGDKLGSTSLVTSDESTATTGFKAVVKEERSYDAFGAVRSPDWRLEDGGYSTGIQQSTLDKGFTGHDDDRELDLVNMKGRVYDPETDRFLTADPNVDGANTTQAWNRYAYVSNNPLTNTDPTGFVLCANCNEFEDQGWGVSEANQMGEPSEAPEGGPDDNDEDPTDPKRRDPAAEEEVQNNKEQRDRAKKDYDNRINDQLRQLEKIKWREKQATVAGAIQGAQGATNDQRLAQNGPIQNGSSSTGVADVNGCAAGPCSGQYVPLPERSVPDFAGSSPEPPSDSTAAASAPVRGRQRGHFFTL